MAGSMPFSLHAPLFSYRLFQQRCFSDYGYVAGSVPVSTEKVFSKKYISDYGYMDVSVPFSLHAPMFLYRL